MKPEQPKSPKSFEQAAEHGRKEKDSISWEEYSKHEAKPVRDQRIERPTLPKSPYDDPSISWEEYSEKARKFKED